MTFLEAMYRRLLALGLELPEDTLVNIHNFSEKNNAYSKFTVITVLPKIWSLIRRLSARFMT